MAALQDGQHTLENTIKALAKDDELVSGTHSANCYFPSYVSTDKVTRYAPLPPPAKRRKEQLN